MYVALEGIDGCGKDTVGTWLSYAADIFPRDRVMRTAEPCEDFESGTLLRELLRGGRAKKAHADLFNANRLELLLDGIIPNIISGNDVVSSRCFLSTLVYQQDHWPLWHLIRTALLLPRFPDVIVVLDLPASVALGRVQRRGREKEYYEKEERLRIYRDRYLSLVDIIPAVFAGVKTRVVDASGEPDVVCTRVRDAVLEEAASGT